MPLYYAVYTWISDVETYWWPLNRAVPTHYAKTLLWAIMIGYTLPTVLMFVPWSDPIVMQNFEALWQPSPMFVPLLCMVFGFIYTKKNPKAHAQHKARDSFSDVLELQKIYVITGIRGLRYTRIPYPGSSPPQNRTSHSNRSSGPISLHSQKNWRMDFTLCSWRISGDSTSLLTSGAAVLSGICAESGGHP